MVTVGVVVGAVSATNVSNSNSSSEKWCCCCHLYESSSSSSSSRRRNHTLVEQQQQQREEQKQLEFDSQENKAKTKIQKKPLFFLLLFFFVFFLGGFKVSKTRPLMGYRDAMSVSGIFNVRFRVLFEKTPFFFFVFHSDWCGIYWNDSGATWKIENYEN